MSASNTFETDLLNLIFLNTNISLVGDATGLRGSSTAGSLYVSLHTADPGEAGNQSTNEISYTGYSRVAVVRSGSGWAVSGNTANNIGAVTFGMRTDAGSATATHWGVGTASSGTGKLLFSAAISPTIAVNQNVTPSLAASTGVLVVAD